MLAESALYSIICRHFLVWPLTREEPSRTVSTRVMRSIHVGSSVELCCHLVSGKCIKYVLVECSSVVNYLGTVPTFNSYTKCMGSPGIIHVCMPDWYPVSYAWMTSQLNVAVNRKLHG